MSKTVALLGAILALSVVDAHAQAQHPALKACKPDIAKFCSNVPPGNNRIKDCMKAHLPELSEPCKEALFQAWLRQ